MVVVNPDDEKLVARVPMGRKVDGVAFDPGSQMVFSSNGAGTLTVIHQDTPDRYTAIDTVQTMRGARTMAVDPSTHRIYLVGADFLPSAKGEKKLKVKPGSAVVLVVGK
jgi:DNA-binding beta-propeller fold protein YncE